MRIYALETTHGIFDLMRFGEPRPEPNLWDGYAILQLKRFSKRHGYCLKKWCAGRERKRSGERMSPWQAVSRDVGQAGDVPKWVVSVPIDFEGVIMMSPRVIGPLLTS
jgi:hypothetical protein